MNIAVIIVELLALFLVFGFLAFELLLINPLTFISDYPPEIRRPVIERSTRKRRRKSGRCS